MGGSADSVEVRQTSVSRPPWAVAADAFREWLDGDRGAMDRLVSAMNPVLWHVVRAYRLDEASAKDVIQDTWVAFVRSYGSIDDPQAISSWLTVTARRTAWRTAKQASVQVATETDELEQTMETEPPAEDAAVARLDQSALWRGVQALSERCQRLLRIVAFDGRPDYRRIAEDLGMPIGSIGPTRARCLDKLRAALALGGSTLGGSTLGGAS
jgi:RNA polymerase sigma factor, sigma-70 family